MRDDGGLRQQLEEAENALAASLQALRTHGRSGLTWAFLQADASRVNELRSAVTARKQGEE